MNRNDLATVLLVVPLVVGFWICITAEQKAEVLYTSPSGAIRIERDGENAWLISTKDPTQRAKMPSLEGISPVDDEYHSSPNEEWILGLRHGGSCLRDGDLFHRVGPDKIDISESFNEMAWKNAAKLSALKRNYSAEGECAMAAFACWSIDSGRLLVRLRGGEDKRDMHEGYIYFNTRTKKFEVTDYLRKLNKTKANVLACAEPVDPLPSEAELKTRFDTLDRRLNTRYAEVLGKTDRERVANVREAQRNWIKHRDEGAKFYVSLFPAAEKELRRLQFLCDVTAARIDTQPDEAWEL